MKQKHSSDKSVIIARISRIHLTWKRYLQRALKPYGITIKQIFVLRHLAEKKFLFPAQLARMLYCDRPTATVIIRNMERQGWITQEQDPENRKRKRISLTQVGRAKFASIPPSKYRTGKTTFNPLSCFNEEEKEQLEELLARFVEHLKQLEDNENTN